MSDIRCLILEDEPLAADVIKTYIGRLPFLTLVGTCENALDAYEFLARQPVDLLFCDIQMPQITGLEFLRSLSHRPLTIMTTAYHEFALDGYDLDVVDYLMKPIAFERFLRAINKAKERLASRQPGRYVAGGGAAEPPGRAAAATPVATTNPQPPATGAQSAPADHIFVKEDGRLVKIFFRDLLYVEGMKDYVKIYTTQRMVVTHLTMKKLEEVLPAHEFMRVHKSYIVRLSEVKAVDGNQLEMNAKTLVPIGLQYRDGVLQAIGGSIV